MARAVQVTFDAASPRDLAMFWREVLDYAVDPPPGGSLGGTPEETIAAWMAFLDEVGMPEKERDKAFAIVDPDGVGPRLFFQKVPETKTAKNRVHLDVRSAVGLTGDERMEVIETEASRLVGLGATRLYRREPGPMELGFVVMADPEGNEFCLD